MKFILGLLACTVVFAQSEAPGGLPLLPVFGTLQSGTTANGNGSTLNVNGYFTAALTVNCTVACSGGTTITFQGSADGTNYTPLYGVQFGASAVSSTVVNQGTTVTVWMVAVAGLQLIRAPISAYSAGTITVTANAVGGNAGPVSSFVNIAGNAAVLSAQQAVTASAVALAANPAKTVCVKALVGNTINVYLGGSGVTTSTGLELVPNQSVCLAVSNSNLLYVIATTTGASVSWIATN